MAVAAVRHPGELRWETRLLSVVVLTLLVFGIATVYGAAGLQTGKAGTTVALSQLSGALIGGLLLVLVARVDYRLWQRWAWPILGVTVFLLIIPLMPFTHAIAPAINGARRWVRVGPINIQPSELARIVVVIWCAMLAAKKGEAVRGFTRGVVPFLVVLHSLATSFLPLALLIVSVLGAILFGLATPSEAAGAGALASLLLAVAYRAFSFQMLKESVYLCARATAMVCYLFIGSWTFSAVFALLGGQSVIENFFLSMNLSSVQFLILAQFIIFLLGWPLEWTEIIIIFVPIFLPLLKPFDVDPIFFGILVALNTQTAFNTPPVAMAAFYLKGVAPPHVTLADIFKGALPFVGMVFLSMVLVYVFPGLVLWLPDYLYTPR